VWVRLFGHCFREALMALIGRTRPDEPIRHMHVRSELNYSVLTSLTAI
jgi:hypothetical protein